MKLSRAALTFVLALASAGMLLGAGCSHNAPNGFPTTDSAQRDAFRLHPDEMPPALRAKYLGGLQNMQAQAQQNVARHGSPSQPGAPAGPAKL